PPSPSFAESPAAVAELPAAASPSPETSAAVALCTAAIRRRRLQHRQSLLIAVELPLRHGRRCPSPSPHPAAAPS
ncbi:unnamed protein product, partial [Cuscuta campestris]